MFRLQPYLTVVTELYTATYETPVRNQRKDILLVSGLATVLLQVAVVLDDNLAQSRRLELH